MQPLVQGAPYSGKIQVDLSRHATQYEIVNDRPEERLMGEDVITPAAVLPTLAAFAVARSAISFLSVHVILTHYLRSSGLHSAAGLGLASLSGRIR